MTPKPRNPVRTPNYPRLATLTVVAALTGCGGQVQNEGNGPGDGGDGDTQVVAGGGDGGSGGQSSMETYLQGVAPDSWVASGGATTTTVLGVGGNAGSSGTTEFGGAAGATSGTGGMGEMDGGAPLSYGGAASTI